MNFVLSGAKWLRLHLMPATRYDLFESEKRITMLIDDVLSDVQDEATVVASVVTLLTNLSAQIAAAGTDPVKLQAVKDLVDKNKAAMAAAVIANTPTPPSTPTA